MERVVSRRECKQKWIEKAVSLLAVLVGSLNGDGGDSVFLIIV
jgi:hypothetical protein